MFVYLYSNYDFYLLKSIYNVYNSRSFYEMPSLNNKGIYIRPKQNS
jgi:hypothetical protein